MRLKVSQNSSSQGVRGDYLSPAMEKSIQLIKVNGLGDVRGDQFVILSKLRDAVHLDSQQYRDSVFLEGPRHVDGF